jgi:uncharacterized OB-fold protein
MSELPIINELNAPFWDAARAGELKLPHCAATNRAFWPPSPISPYSENAAVEWRSVDPRGVVRALCVYRRVFLKAFEPLAPFAIALVELGGGARLQAHLSDPGALQVGDRVKLEFRVLVEGGAPALTAERLD